MITTEAYFGRLDNGRSQQHTDHKQYPENHPGKDTVQSVCHSYGLMLQRRYNCNLNKI